jgi:hypothetical protein
MKLEKLSLEKFKKHEIENLHQVIGGDTEINTFKTTTPDCGTGKQTNTGWDDITPFVPSIPYSRPIFDTKGNQIGGFLKNDGGKFRG